MTLLQVVAFSFCPSRVCLGISQWYIEKQKFLSKEKFSDTTMGRKQEKYLGQWLYAQEKRLQKCSLYQLNTRNSSRNVKLAWVHLVSINKWSFLWVVWRFSLSHMNYVHCLVHHIMVYYVGVPSQNGWVQSGRPICATERCNDFTPAT